MFVLAFLILCSLFEESHMVTCLIGIISCQKPPHKFVLQKNYLINSLKLSTDFSAISEQALSNLSKR